MELKDLEYFLAITRHGSLSEAARSLYLSQPALTRSLKALEQEMGKQLVIRGSRRIELTEDGFLFRRRAEEILELAEKTKQEIRVSENLIEGDISVCAGESKALHFLTQAAKRVMEVHPKVRLHISSGDGKDVQERLDQGLADFGLMFPPFDEKKYSSLRIPFVDRWGLFMRKDSPLAEKPFVTAKDLVQLPLIAPRGFYERQQIGQLVRLPQEDILVVATYSLIFNGVLMVTDGMGYLLGLNNIVNLTGKTVQCFRPLEPAVMENMCVCWKKYAPMSRQAAALLEEMHRQEESDVQFLFPPLS